MLGQNFNLPALSRLRRWFLSGLFALGLAVSSGAWGQITATTQALSLTLDFGDQPINVERVGIIKLQASENVKFADPSVDTSTLSGTPFSVDDGCKNLELSNGGSCIISVRFKPSNSITYLSYFSIKKAATNNYPGAIVKLTGKGITVGENTGGTSSLPPLLVIEPSVLDFGDVPINTSKTAVLRLANRGGSPLTAQIARSDNQFLPLAGSCYYSGSLNLAAGASCSLSVQFKPTQIGNITGKLTFSGSGANGLAVEVKGRGTGSSSSAPTGVLVASPTNIVFGSLELGSSVVREVRLSLSGTDQRPSLIGVGVPEGFHYEHDCATATGSTCTLRLAFAPTEVKDYQGFVIVDAANGTSAFITVSGTGSRSVRLSATTRGDVATQNVIGQFRFAADQLGQVGNLYVALLHDDKLYFQSYGQWQAYQPGIEPQPYLSGRLTDTDLTIVSTQDAARYPGAVLFLGYGRNFDELLANRQYAPVMVIE